MLNIKLLGMTNLTVNLITLQMDQFSLIAQFYDCFVRDKSLILESVVLFGKQFWLILHCVAFGEQIW